MKLHGISRYSVFGASKKHNGCSPGRLNSLGLRNSLSFSALSAQETHNALNTATYETGIARHILRDEENRTKPSNV
jgi:hypothetical protein